MTEIIKRLTLELPSLPPKMAKAARFALDEPEKIAFKSMRSVATSCEITTPTMLRLARHMGFENYEKFKEQFQQSFVQQSFSTRAGALRSTNSKKGGEAVIENLFSTTLENVSKTIDKLDLHNLQQMAKMMCEAKTNYILGSGSMHWVASILQSTGRMAMPNLCVPGSGNTPFIEIIGKFDQEDLILALAISPYAKSTIDIVRLAHSKGIPVIVITDKPSSPLLEFASYYVLAQTDSPHYYPSIVSILALIEALLALIVASHDQELVDRIEEIEKLRDECGAYQL